MLIVILSNIKTGYFGLRNKIFIGFIYFVVDVLLLRHFYKSGYLLGFKLRVSNVGSPACDNNV